MGLPNAGFTNAGLDAGWFVSTTDQWIEKYFIPMTYTPSTVSCSATEKPNSKNRLFVTSARACARFRQTAITLPVYRRRVASKRKIASSIARQQRLDGQGCGPASGLPVNGSLSGSLAIEGASAGRADISHAVSGNDDGVTPQQARVTSGVGAVVGDGDAPGFGDRGLRQRCGQGPIGVADIGQVVHDVVAAVRDAHSDRAIGQESGARDGDLVVVR